ncbi:helix-turn-helix domain-containing protein [Salipiger sp. 1_MG-2023]|uniref:helix-turn-helix domain-containing protein n=1 Tax=Salipiger sp. 1_MG-2023 TaxID=3062665 RepID=UPI0026E3FD7E|nr:helix-turn-helix domain-containing protein [Salipiger sp. 1_MG-2023]MDO6586834.1 helix-turn-helix domain-containing protein [Salipiger sp. 1_MG-2023]
MGAGVSSTAKEYELVAPEGRHLIVPGDWERLRFGWVDAVISDASLGAQAQVVAHVLAMRYANRHTAQCDPGLAELERATGRSRSTLKRAISELIDAGWITRVVGRGRGNRSGYGFLTRARIVTLKGARSVPKKGDNPEPFSGSEKGSDQGCQEKQKGSNLNGKGVKSEPPYYIDKPCKNHGATDRPRNLSDNPMVIRDSQRAVERFRSGHADAFDGLQIWIIDHIIAANLLTPEERERAELG